MTVRRAALRLTLVLGAILGLGGILGVRGAWAHAGLQDTSPRAGAVLEAAPNDIVLDFAAEIESTLSSVELFDATGQHITLDKPVSTPDRTQVVVPVRSPDDLGAGVYVVRYRVTSLDSHVERDAFTFQIGTGQGAQQEVLARIGANRNGSVVLAWSLGVLRFLSLVGLAMLLGSWTIAILDKATRDGVGATRRLLTQIGWAGIAVIFATALLTFALQGAQSRGKGIGGIVDVSAWPDVVRARFGITLVVRLVLVALSGLVAGGLGLVAQRVWRIAAAVLATCLVVTYGLVGHPGVDETPAVGLLLDAIHLLAVCAWIGGLICLVVGRRSWLTVASTDRSTATQRFIRLVPFGVTTVVVSGVLQVWRITGNANVLAGSVYGRAIVGKLALVAIVLIVAMFGWTVLRRLGATSASRLLVAQSVLGVAVLAVSAGIVTLNPVVTVLLQPATVSVSAGAVTAIVTVTPARVGSDDFHVIVDEKGALQPSTATKLFISFPDRGVPDVAIPMAPDGPDHYSAFGVQVPYAGIWQLVIEVETPSGVRTVLTAQVTIAP